MSALNRLKQGEVRFSSGVIYFEEAKKKKKYLTPVSKVLRSPSLPSSQLRGIGRINLFVPHAAARPLIPCTAHAGDN